MSSTHARTFSKSVLFEDSISSPQFGHFSI
jgi:hypothetical protein